MVIPSYYYDTSSVYVPQVWTYVPPASRYRTVSGEDFKALTKQRVAARTRSILRDVARRQGWQARSEIERRRRFHRQARQVTRRGACGRERG